MPTKVINDLSKWPQVTSPSSWWLVIDMTSVLLLYVIKDWFSCLVFMHNHVFQVSVLYVEQGRFFSVFFNTSLHYQSLCLVIKIFLPCSSWDKKWRHCVLLGWKCYTPTFCPRQLQHSILQTWVCFKISSQTTHVFFQWGVDFDILSRQCPIEPTQLPGDVNVSMFNKFWES